MSKNDRSVNYEWPSTYSGSCNNWNNREMYSLQILYWEITFSDYCCLFTLKLTVDFFLLQLPTFGLNVLFSIASFGIPLIRLGKGDWNFPIWKVDRRGSRWQFTCLNKVNIWYEHICLFWCCWKVASVHRLNVCIYDGLRKYGLDPWLIPTNVGKSSSVVQKWYQVWGLWRKQPIPIIYPELNFNNK